MSGKPRILFVTDAETPALPVSEELANAFQIVRVDSSLQAISRLSEQPCAGILVDSEHFRDAQQIERLLDNERILESMPDGVALLDFENRIVWANERFCKWAESEEVIGENFYRALGSPEILGPDFCPLNTTRGSGVPSSSTLKVAESFYCQVHVARIQGMQE
ncbi:MAG: PAS domain-containing protein, partial [Pirellulaceae bacterium]|nr:PAS domain-containing protein [Pirellulaceae bacterium]